MTSIEDRLTATPEEVGMSGAGMARLSRLVQSYVDDGKIAGAITIVARAGRTVFFETCGNMDDEAGRPMEPDAIFRIYSMTKPIASVALMTLYEEGRFQLDDPASRFIPEFAGLKVFDSGTAEAPVTREPAREMTVRDLLIHTSGLVGAGNEHPVRQLYLRAGLLGSRSDMTLAEAVRRLADVPLYCDPGAEWNYGISTDLVGYLCEVISGQPFDQFLAERVFEPLGMPDTGFHVPAGKAGRLAACYRKDDPALNAGRHYSLEDAPANSRYLKERPYFSGAGGLVSTADDYQRFCDMLVGDGAVYTDAGEVRILGSRTLEYMASNHLPGDVDLAAMGQPQFTETRMDGIGFGLGFAVLLDPAVAQVIGTPGEYYWGGAASTAFFISPGEDLSVVFLPQLMISGSWPFRRELRSVVYGAITD